MVGQWYVILSPFGYYWMDYDRHVSDYFCQDLTPPSIAANMPEVATERAAMNLQVWDLHSQISTVGVYINGSEIFRRYPHLIIREPTEKDMEAP